MSARPSMAASCRADIPAFLRILGSAPCLSSTFATCLPRASLPVAYQSGGMPRTSPNLFSLGSFWLGSIPLFRKSSTFSTSPALTAAKNSLISDILSSCGCNKVRVASSVALSMGFAPLESFASTLAPLSIAPSQCHDTPWKPRYVKAFHCLPVDMRCQAWPLGSASTSRHLSDCPTQRDGGSSKDLR